MGSMFCFSLSSPFPKTSIDPVLYVHVELALKHLKLQSRRLSATLTVLEEESRVLDRLYYKGKNQHRTSLFWRHVEEMRRFCLRINSLDLSGTLIRLRHSFYDSTSYNNQSVLKGPWSHVPQIGDMKTMIRNFTPVRQLLLKACERLMSAYCSFKRAMQSGAFLHLILTLSAIACRLRSLVQAVLETQEEISLALTELCVLLKLPPRFSVPKDQPTFIASQQPPIPILVPSALPKETPALGSKFVPQRDKKKARLTDRLQKRRELGELESKWESISLEVAADADVDEASLKSDKHAHLPAARCSKQRKRIKIVDDIDKIFGF